MLATIGESQRSIGLEDRPIPDEPSNRRAFWVLIAAVVVTFCAFTNVQPLLPLYVLKLGVGSLQDAALWTGVLLGASPLIAAISAPFWGMVADRYGYKPVIQRSLFGFTVIFAVMAFATSVWHLLALRIMTGFVSGFSAQATAMAATLVPRKQTGWAISMVQVAQVIGSAVGPLLGGVVGDRYGFAGAVLAASALNGVAALTVTALLHEQRPAVDGSVVRKRPPFRFLFGLAGFVPMMVALAAIRLVERSFDPLIPLLVVKLQPASDVAGSLAGVIISVGTVATAISAGLTGRLSERVQTARFLQAILVGGAAISLPFAIAASPWHVLVLRLLLGLVAGGAMTLALTYAARNVPADRRGAAFGMLGGAALYGSAIGVIVAGSLARLHFELPFLAAAALYLLAAAATELARRQRARVAVGTLTR